MARRRGMGTARRRPAESHGRNFVFDSGRWSSGFALRRGREGRTQMIQHAAETAKSSLAAIKALTFLMFMMFAMTTDSVGVIIPEIIKQFGLSMTAASAFQYATMGGIAVAGFCLGFMADRFGRKKTIVVGLTLFAADAYLFVFGSSFAFFVGLLAVSGVSIGVFKTGALALIGDISRSTTEHTTIMNAVEGFFGLGSIIGPALLAKLLLSGVDW